MSTKHYDKAGKFLREEPGTQYHPDGTGPRDSEGKPLSGPVAAAAAAEAEAAAKNPSAPVADAKATKNKDDAK